MDREALESNDLKLRQKVGKLRSNLAQRHQTYERKRKARLGLKLGVPLLVVTAVGYYVSGNTALTRPSPPPIAYENRQTLAVVSRDFLPLSTPSPPLASPASPTVELSAAAPPPAVETLPPVDTPVLADTPPVLADLPGASVDTPQGTPTSAVAPAVASAPSSPAEPPAARTRVARSLTCLMVEDRQCVGARSVFALHAHPNPHVWMDVRSQALPDVLKHIYYHNGEKYDEVTLTIQYPRMRTWSNITLHNPAYVGDWRVEITTEDGTVLTQLAFRVTP